MCSDQGVHEKLKKHSEAVLPLLIICLIAVLFLSMMIGRYPITPDKLVLLFKERITGNTGALDKTVRTVFWTSRFPRMVIAVMIGAALSLSGAAYQGILRNPMIAPDILGASSGASFGAAVGILLGLSSFKIQLLAFLCGAAAVGLAFFVSNSIKGSDSGGILMLVLSGMVVTALFSAGISIIKYIGDPYDTLPALTFWLMGGLQYVSASDVPVLLVPMLIGVIPLLLLRWRMNVLCFSDEEASAMGVNARRTRGIVIVCATLLTSSSVAVGGMIGWVGLLIPHICRMLVGPDYRRLLPVTLAAGALFLVLVDDAARSITAQELPLGILTALIGAPFFMFLLYRGRRSFL